ncbi:hypothetical protein SL003B_1171 [Polymorphum gilvum SL003B-26A1]|uniref:Uncharacterized protein n=1 Tax=Polymorphum gilvum (strain LMG 25793 / CGMCC 1.9160 / SL003B-26A1) TaxID=991905 RepID=F2IZP3_POLGS|nr:hypothetical protein SL003B_1171 [Polymorphum gilvum SL003B-26A1]
MGAPVGRIPGSGARRLSEPGRGGSGAAGRHEKGAKTARAGATFECLRHRRSGQRGRTVQKDEPLGVVWICAAPFDR